MQMAAPTVHLTCQWQWIWGCTAGSTQQCFRYMSFYLCFGRKLQSEAWRCYVSM